MIGKRWRDAEGGATLIEAAVAFPLMILMIVGIIEFGMAFKDFLTVSAASREGARIVALAGTHDQADCAVVVGIADLVSPGDLDRIERIEIYEATGSGGQGATNVAVRNPSGDPMECDQPHSPDGGIDGWTINPVSYPPGARQTEVGDEDLDIVGVRVIMDRSWITGFPPFRGTFTINEATITRVEPEVFAQ